MSTFSCFSFNELTWNLINFLSFYRDKRCDLPWNAVRGVQRRRQRQLSRRQWRATDARTGRPVVSHRSRLSRVQLRQPGATWNLPSSSSYSRLDIPCYYAVVAIRCDVTVTLFCTERMWRNRKKPFYPRCFYPPNYTAMAIF